LNCANCLKFINEENSKEIFGKKVCLECFATLLGKLINPCRCNQSYTFTWEDTFTSSLVDGYAYL